MKSECSKTKKIISFIFTTSIFLLFVGCSMMTEQESEKLEKSTEVSPSSMSTTMSDIIDSELPENASSNSINHKTSFDEKQFTNFMSYFCAFVNDPVEEIEELKNVDLLPFFVHIAEQYAQLQGKSYATEEESAYLFPMADLEKLSKNIFGFDFNFEPSKALFYERQNGEKKYRFNPSTNELFTLFGGAPSPEPGTDISVCLLDILSTEIAGDELIAVCRLEYSHGLGTSAVNQETTYRFKMIDENGVTYYQIKAVEAQRG